VFNKLKKLISGKVSSARKSGVEITVKKNKFGVVDVDSEVIRRYIERDALSVEGVHNLRASVEDFGNHLKISLEIVLKQNNSAPEVSTALENTIRDILKKIFEITEVDFGVKITEIVQNETSEKRRKLK